jgi:ketosteroid isomerase-like protein
VTEAEVRAAIDAFAADWAAFDAEALLDHFALPQIVYAEGSTSFLESEDEVRANLEATIALYREKGVASVVATETHVEPLPDGAARALVRWRLADAAGATVLEFKTIYTLVTDDDGEAAIVAIDADGEMLARRAAGWA